MQNEDLDKLIQRLNSIENLLLKQQEQSSKKEKETITIQEVAELLGRSVDTIYSYTSTKRIPHYKPNGTLLFFRTEIIEWIKSGKVRTLDEIDALADASLIEMNKRRRA